MKIFFILALTFIALLTAACEKNGEPDKPDEPEIRNPYFYNAIWKISYTIRYEEPIVYNLTIGAFEDGLIKVLTTDHKDSIDVRFPLPDISWEHWRYNEAKDTVFIRFRRYFEMQQAYWKPVYISHSYYKLDMAYTQDSIHGTGTSTKAGPSNRLIVWGKRVRNFIP